MKKAVLMLMLLSHFCMGEDGLKLVFEKNKGGEVVLRITGHTSPVTVQLNDQTVTVYPEENVLNLSAMGIETLLLALRTDSGEKQKNDNNAMLPVVTSNPSPPLSTPY